ncbi:glutamyl-tRNA reductase [Actinotalea sp. M2MS4P-6]|uniref:glutamyl-tRNA reductase n=1 Tax=Actinotalea sp. M2MS4P-6 TaxID=2983762 RepID=UPI0021E3E37A|nr:glutamyl-tRNA reductase [Actinotalea sp. M2MS4P-6]MCV2392908.1 glutamyl-tRNA reductase [Actinotalea sp. M2MS4P-6]
MNLAASHRNLDLDLLEQISVGAQSVTPAISADPAVRGAVVLSTCNRFEVYLDVDDVEAAATGVAHAVAAATGVAEADVRDRLEVAVGDEVVTRLFTVAAGLDSMVVGEREIAGQVRRALDDARVAGAVSSDLEALFQGASRVSRAVARRTGLADAGRSVVAVALDLAEQRRRLSGARVLLIGTGSYAGASVAALRERGVAEIAVHSPSGRAATFAADRGLRAARPEDLAVELAEADVVVACSGSSGWVVDANAVRAARATGRGPSVLVDLALRRDLDPAVASVPDVTLVDLVAVAEHGPATLGTAVAEGRVIVDAEAARLLAVLAERDAGPAVRAVRAHVEETLIGVAARYQDEPQVQRALRQFAAALLHQPVHRARSYARLGRTTDFEQALATVLGLTPAEGHGDAVRDPAGGLSHEQAHDQSPDQGPEQSPDQSPDQAHEQSRGQGVGQG